MTRYNYENLISKLKSSTDDYVAPTYDQLGDLLQKQLPDSLVRNGGLTKKHPIVRAILRAGFVVDSNSPKDKTIKLRRDEREAENTLKKTDTNSTVRKMRILLNVVFPHSAGYFDKKGNIGHEIIDIFGADDGKYNYYVNPRGLIDGKKFPEIVISISQASTGLYKILNKAVVKDCEEAALAKKANAKNANLQKEQEKKFKYNGKYLENYFEDNPGKSTVLSSLKCEGIYEPSKPLYFAFKSFKRKKLKSGFYRIESTSPGRTTRFINFNQEDQKMLETLVDNDELWEKDPIKSFKKYADEYNESADFNYFKEIGVKDQELQYSNAIRFFLDDYGLANDFLKRIGCSVEKDDGFRIEREAYNIDLLFTNFNKFAKPKDNAKEKIVIIENKIKANVTPSDNDKTLNEQIEEIYEYVYGDESKNVQSKGMNDCRKYFDSNDQTGKVPSQLSKYYIYAVMLANKRGWPEKKIKNDIKCFFLVPEYSRVHYDVSKTGYLENNTFVGKNEPLFLQEKYKLITYKDILPVFEECLKTADPNKKVNLFLEDFIGSMRDQSKDRDDSLEQEMIKLFYLRSKNI